MNNADGTTPGGHGAQDDGWVQPFRVFFDRAFEHSFSEAKDLCNGDESMAAQLCAQAFGRAYARWALLGRIGDAQAFIDRRLRRGARSLPDAPPLREAGVGYKPWVYVTATESGTSRKQARLFLSGAVATMCAFLFTMSAFTSAPNKNDVSISGETPRTTTTSGVQSTPTSPTSSLVIEAGQDTSSPNDGSKSDDDTEDSDWTGFTLNLDDLPKSPSEIGAASPTARTPTTVHPSSIPSTSSTSSTSSTTSTTVVPATTILVVPAPPATIPPTTSTTTSTTTLAPTTTTSTTTTTVAPTTTSTSVAPPATDRDSESEEREREREERATEREERKREREERKDSA